MCVASLFMWARSYRVADVVGWGPGPYPVGPDVSSSATSFSLESCRGGVRFCLMYETYDATAASSPFTVNSFGGFRGHRSVPLDRFERGRPALRPFTSLGYSQWLARVGTPGRYMTDQRYFGL